MTTYSLRGGGIDIDVDLADGGRVTGLVALGREWLVACGPRTPGDYVQQGSGGWDEIAPTVSACVLADGTRLADHGDVWQTPWTLDSADELHVQASVRLSSVPITLSRRIEASDVGIRLSWWATTDCESPVAFFWCAHPLFAAGPGTRIRVAGDPPLVEEYPGPRIERGWPGEVGNSAIKAFTAESVSRASVVHGNGDTLTLDWDSALLPYLGLYWDGGEFTQTPVVAIEPATGYGDSASRAEADGRVLTVRAGAPHRWWMDLTVTRGGRTS